MQRPRLSFEIFVISLAAILLEISLTRVFSFKLVYYFTYAILGIALLGMGAGGVFVAMIPRERRAALDRMIPLYCLLAALGVFVSYLAVLWLPVNALEAVRALPQGEMGTFLREGGKLALLCVLIFLPFLGAGLAISTILATNPDRINRLYGFDLVGAALGCAIAVPVMLALSPPGGALLGGALFAMAGLPLLRGAGSRMSGVLAATSLVLLAGALLSHRLPDPVVDSAKTMGIRQKVLFSRWHPIFRVDVLPFPTGSDHVRVISHDGMWGAVLPSFDGDLGKLTRYETDERSYPFRLIDRPRVAIVGAAGGNEVLASLYFGAEHVTAVELNPVTVSLLTDHYKDYTGGLAEHERVTLVNAEGRSFFMSSPELYDVIWFVTPDSYAAMNAASSGAYVLSESYLYTVEMLIEAFEHLSTDGIIVTQFGGERDPQSRPAMSARYLATAREAFRRLGIEDFARHVMVSTYPSYPLGGCSLVLKRSPVTEADIERFTAATKQVRKGKVRFSWKEPRTEHPYQKIIRGDPAELENWYDAYPYQIHPVTDDAPFFWHIVRFRTALATSFEPTQSSHKSGIGERLLVLLLVIATVLAAVFLLAPLRLRRHVWREIPHKGPAAVYFASLGTGFMFLEVSLIQRFTLFLGYPTYSLSVTLFALLLSTGIGSLMSERLGARSNRLLGVLAAALVGLALFYTVGLTPLFDGLVGGPLALRIAVAVMVLAPLGVCLGVFMPLGLRTVAATTSRGEEYVAWAWAINGFFSVISSLLSSILSMIIGFTLVMWVAVGIYLIGMAALARIPLGHRAAPS
jgi:spermidine synthase